MSKTLIIAEKPSVARDIVAAIGGFKQIQLIQERSIQVWESEEYVCTHALGHLLELYSPEDYRPELKIWSLKDLPIVPPSFLLKPKSETAPLLKGIKQLLARPDITEIINACDAAREGELIFRELIAFSHCTKPIKRVWLQSLTSESIRNSFQALKPGEAYQGLANAASSRSYADWLVGMNLSRALTLKLARASEPGVWSAGRVQTPTLAMLVNREFEILSHSPEPYFTVHAKFKAIDHEYEGTWIKVLEPKEGTQKNFDNPKHIHEKNFAESLVTKLIPGATATAVETRKTRLQAAPSLFHLTSLQRYMANHFQWTAKHTLSTAQSCYEHYKVITYPRTETDCLPEDYSPKLKSIFESLAKIDSYKTAAEHLLNHPWHNESLVFDSSKISDHFAIIPTGGFPASLPKDEGLLFDIIIRRTLAALMAPAEIDQVERFTTVEGECFKTGPEEAVRNPGWQVVMPGKNKKSELNLLPLKEDSQISLDSIHIKSEHTKPPPRIGEAQLLTMMEFAGRHVEDPDLAKILNKTGGLGTAATRAEIIENLKQKGFVFENLQPTVKGMHLVRYLKLSRAENLTSPLLTAELERRLYDIEHQKCTKDLFLSETVSAVSSSLDALNQFDINLSFAYAPALGPCPKCSKSKSIDVPTVHERMWNYSCQTNFITPPQNQADTACGFTLPKDLEGRYLDPISVKKLLQNFLDNTDASVTVDGFPGDFPSASKNSGTEKRLVKLIKSGDVEVKLLDGSATLPTTKTYKTESSQVKRATWGTCPVHKGDECLIVETKKAFICESRLRDLKSGQDSSSGLYLPKTLCGRSLKYDEIRSFIKEGRTKKIEDFTSKGGKKFAASIVRLPSGAWNLDFQ